MIERMRRDVTGFIADFGQEVTMNKVLEREKVKIPDQWKKCKDGFVVKEDSGKVLTLGFLNHDKGEQIGEETFEVTYDEVNSWA
jgi:hypothetical protein